MLGKNNKIKRLSFFWLGLVIIFIGLAFVYRDVLFKGKILFPANFLASFYSPWSTVKFSGWEQGIPAKPIGGNDQVRMFYPSGPLSTNH